MTDIQKLMMATFLSLRVAVGVIGIVFPLLLWGGGNTVGIHLADSMSAYYHASRDCIDPKRTEPNAPCWLTVTYFINGKSTPLRTEIPENKIPDLGREGREPLNLSCELPYVLKFPQQVKANWLGESFCARL
jgi:hypothetical protein